MKRTQMASEPSPDDASSSSPPVNKRPKISEENGSHGAQDGDGWQKVERRKSKKQKKADAKLEVRSSSEGIARVRFEFAKLSRAMARRISIRACEFIEAAGQSDSGQVRREGVPSCANASTAFCGGRVMRIPRYPDSPLLQPT